MLSVFKNGPCMQPAAGRRSSLQEAANQIELAIAHFCSRGFPGGLVVKNLPANAGGPGDTSSIPRSGKTRQKRKWQLLQYSCLGKPMNRRAWQATVHGVAKSQMQLST